MRRSSSVTWCANARGEFLGSPLPNTRAQPSRTLGTPAPCRCRRTREGRRGRTRKTRGGAQGCDDARTWAQDRGGVRAARAGGAGAGRAREGEGARRGGGKERRVEEQCLPTHVNWRVEDVACGAAELRVQHLCGKQVLSLAIKIRARARACRAYSSPCKLGRNSSPEPLRTV